MQTAEVSLIPDECSQPLLILMSAKSNTKIKINTVFLSSVKPKNIVLYIIVPKLIFHKVGNRHVGEAFEEERAGVVAEVAGRKAVGLQDEELAGLVSGAFMQTQH